MLKYKTFRLKNSFSFLINKIVLKTILILVFCLIVVFILSASLGDIKINPLNVLYVFFGNGSEMDTLVVQSFRLPRIIIAMLVGISLAISGSILQGMVRNPLASPDIIGITGGASVFVVAFLAMFSDENNALVVSIKWMPLAAFIGATLVGVLVYSLAWKNGVSPIRLVLIGIGVSALMQALTTLFMILGPIYRASQANIWLTGTVYGSTWENVRILTPWVLVLLLIIILSARHLNIQELGEEVATSVGSSVQIQRFLLLFVSTGLAGGAVAFAGGIGFVGLMAPHIARRIVGSSFGGLIPTAGLIGAILVILADLIGRTIFLPLEVPAGVFTAAIGAPYFIYLLFKSRNG